MNIHRNALSDTVAVFAPAGELDAYTGPQLREVLTEAVEEGACWLVLDMTKVEYIDSVGLGIIVGAAKKTALHSGNLAVVGSRPNVLRVFEISGTRELLNVVETLAEAQERLGWPEGKGCGCEDTPAHADCGCEDTAKGGEQ